VISSGDSPSFGFLENPACVIEGNSIPTVWDVQLPNAPATGDLDKL